MNTSYKEDDFYEHYEQNVICPEKRQEELIDYETKLINRE